MAEKSGFFDAIVTNGVADRVYSADDINQIFDGLLSDGVFRLYQNALQVTAGDGLRVNVNTGKAIVNKHWYINTTVKNVAISTAHATLDRYSSVVLRYSRTNRSVILDVINAEPSSSPALPVLTKNNDVHEIRLANVLVKAGVTSLSDTDITDARQYAGGLVDSPALAYRRYTLKVTDHDIQRYFDIPDTYNLTVNTYLSVYADGVLCSESDYSLMINEVEGNMMVVFTTGKPINTVMEFIMIN